MIMITADMYRSNPVIYLDRRLTVYSRFKTLQCNKANQHRRVFRERRWCV